VAFRLIALAVLALAIPAAAQDRQPAAPTGSSQTIRFVKTGLFMIAGGGGNTVVRLSGNGIILVDGKLSGQYPALMAQVRRIAEELPVRMLIVTSLDRIHTGTDSEFLTAGIPVIGQAKVKEALARASPGEQIAPPSLTFDSARTIKLGGVTAQLLHYGNARTSGDAVVYFPDLKVLAVGDLLTSAAPHADAGDGGSLAEWGRVLGQVMTLDFDTVVPGQGPVATRADLEAFKARIDAQVQRGTPDEGRRPETAVN
jgi:glyoxylase-like metal-dependent hydrolase (beta-lactamase superfamily II)